MGLDLANFKSLMSISKSKPMALNFNLFFWAQFFISSYLFLDKSALILFEKYPSSSLKTTQATTGTPASFNFFTMPARSGVKSNVPILISP